MPETGKSLAGLRRGGNAAADGRARGTLAEVGGTSERDRQV